MRKRIIASLVGLLFATQAGAQVQLGSGQVYGNSTAARAPAQGSTVTAILDRALGSTRGAIIERGASGWAIVGPSATAGLPWVSNGAGADPAYQVLGAVGGGTGLNIYAVGDILCATGTTTLSRIADVATGQILRSGGVGACPAWGTGSALTKTDDTNVTATLGGSPTVALVNPASITLGWTGTLAVARGGTGGGTASGTLLDNITAFAGTGYIRRTGAGAYAFSSASSSAQYLAGTATNVPIEPSVIYPAEVTITYGATTTIDFSTLINGVVTLTGNISTLTLTNVQAGKSGQIRFVQSGAGSFTWPAGGNTIFKYAGGSLPALTTGSTTAVDVLVYSCSSATFCTASLMKDVRNP